MIWIMPIALAFFIGIATQKLAVDCLHMKIPEAAWLSTAVFATAWFIIGIAYAIKV